MREWKAKKKRETRISVLTMPLHSQVIYDIEIDDNFYYMHFRLNLRNKIADYSFLLLLLSYSSSSSSSHRSWSACMRDHSFKMHVHFVHVWLCLFFLISFWHCNHSGHSAFAHFAGQMLCQTTTTTKGWKDVMLVPFSIHLVV